MLSHAEAISALVASQPEYRAQRGSGVEIVVHRFAERDLRGSSDRRKASVSRFVSCALDRVLKGEEAVVDALHRGAGLLQAGVAEAQRAPVMSAEHQHAYRVRVVLGQHVPQSPDVAERLRHLLGVDVQHPGVHPVPGEAARAPGVRVGRFFLATLGEGAVSSYWPPTWMASVAHDSVDIAYVRSPNITTVRLLFPGNTLKVTLGTTNAISSGPTDSSGTGNWFIITTMPLSHVTGVVLDAVPVYPSVKLLPLTVTVWPQVRWDGSGEIEAIEISGVGVISLPRSRAARLPV